MSATMRISLLVLLCMILGACGPFWDAVREPDLQGPSWDITLELPVIGKTENTRIIPVKILWEGLTSFEGPVSLIQEQIEKIGPIEIELPTEAQELMGEWLLRAEFFAEVEHRLPFGAEVALLLSEDRDSLFSDPGHQRLITLPLSEPEHPVVTTVSLDFDLTETELVKILTGRMYVGASVLLVVPEGETRIRIDTNHYIWPKVWVSLDVRVNPGSEKR